MNLTVSILDKFGEASGLQTNLQKKSCVIPIRCEPAQMELVTSTLPCAPADFPYTYLGLPVSTRKIGKVELLKWIEKISDKLLCWNAALMNMAG